MFMSVKTADRGKIVSGRLRSASTSGYFLANLRFAQSSARQRYAGSIALLPRQGGLAVEPFIQLLHALFKTLLCLRYRNHARL